MINHITQLEYISEKLLFIKLKVEQDTKSGLFDINKYGEDIFMHLLNSAYGFKISNANEVFYNNFPAIDLIDEENEVLIQVTSTLTTDKIYSTIKKKDKNNELKEYKDYKLKMCYIAGSPKFSDLEILNIKKRGITEEDLLDLNTIISIAQNNQQKCKDIYYTLNQRLDSKAYNLDIENHFNKFETQLNENTTKKFSSYDKDFEEFLNSDNNVLEVFATGGHGKSHLLKHLASLKNEYTPIIFTKQDNVESDLKKLDFTKQYLLIYDDIDRFLENGIASIFSFLIDSGSKIVISFRTPSKSLVEEEILKFNALKPQELYITWIKDEIRDLILLIKPEATDFAVNSINAQFNSNPFLITQYLKGGIKEIKSFSKKTLSDSVTALQKFEIKVFEIEVLLFRIALLSPCPRNLVDINDKDKRDELISVGVLRELNNKIRFNADVLGDLYLASFVEKYENKYKEITREYIEEHLELIITNLSYVLGYENNDSLELFFKDIINGWIKDKDYRSSNLRILYRIVNYAPFESFRYLKKVTDNLSIKENEHQKLDGIAELMAQVCEVDFNNSDEHINLGSIVPIINKLISNLKNKKELGRLKMKYIIDFLVSPKIISCKEPHFANHNISVVVNDMLIPFELKSNNVIIEALDVMKKWLTDNPINITKIEVIKSALCNLFMGTIQYREHTGQKTYEFNTTKVNISKVLDKAKEIVLLMINSSSIDLKCIALDILRDIGNSINKELKAQNEQYYYEVTIEIFDNLKEQIVNVKDYRFLSKLDEVLLNAMAYRKHKDESFLLLVKIPRTPIFTFNQLLVGKFHIIYNIDKFIEEYPKQKDVKEWINSIRSNKYYLDTSKDDKDLYNYFINTYITTENFINFINSLHFIENSTKSYEFTKLLNYWYEQKPQLFKKLAIKGITNISNNDAYKTVDDFLFDLGLTTLDIDCIDETLEISELKRYVENSFRNKNIELYQKLLMIFKNAEKENISWFINSSFPKIYFVIKNDSDFNTYRPYIHELLDLIIKHRITPPIHLTFILEYLEKKNIQFELIKQKIRKIIHIPYFKNDLEEVIINKDECKKLLNILDYKLENLFSRIFSKIILKAKFVLCQEEHDIYECFLIKDYIKDYKDYEKFISLVLDYYNSFTYHHTYEDGSSSDFKIDINYFFNGLKNEYFDRYINEQIKKNNTQELIVLIDVIPIKANFKKLLVDTFNFLDTCLSNEKIITLLRKDRIQKYEYEEFLNNKKFNIGGNIVFDVTNKEINDQEELFIYISENILDIDILIEIEEIIAEIQEAKNTVSEINLEQTIT